MAPGVAGCSNGATVCSGNTCNAMDPRTGQILTAVGAANTQAAGGTPLPGTGNPPMATATDLRNGQLATLGQEG